MLGHDVEIKLLIHCMRNFYIALSSLCTVKLICWSGMSMSCWVVDISWKCGTPIKVAADIFVHLHFDRQGQKTRMCVCAHTPHVHVTDHITPWRKYVPTALPSYTLLYRYMHISFQENWWCLVLIPCVLLSLSLPPPMRLFLTSSFHILHIHPFGHGVTCCWLPVRCISDAHPSWDRLCCVPMWTKSWERDMLKIRFLNLVLWFTREIACEKNLEDDSEKFILRW